MYHYVLSKVKDCNTISKYRFNLKTSHFFISNRKINRSLNNFSFELIKLKYYGIQTLIIAYKK